MSGACRAFLELSLSSLLLVCGAPYTGSLHFVSSAILFRKKERKYSTPSQWGTANAEIKVPSAVNPKLSNLPSFKSGASQNNIASRVSPVARNCAFKISASTVHLPSRFPTLLQTYRTVNQSYTFNSVNLVHFDMTVTAGCRQMQGHVSIYISHFSLGRRGWGEGWGWGGHEGPFSRDSLPVSSAVSHCEQFSWPRQGCPLLHAVHPAFPLPTMVSPTLNGALQDGSGETDEAREMSECLSTGSSLR